MSSEARDKRDLFTAAALQGLLASGYMDESVKAGCTRRDAEIQVTDLACHLGEATVLCQEVRDERPEKKV